MVEEIPDHSANDPVHPRDDPCIPAAFHRLQLSESIRLVDRHARRDVLFSLPRLLQRSVQKEESEEREAFRQEGRQEGAK